MSEDIDTGVSWGLQAAAISPAFAPLAVVAGMFFGGKAKKKRRRAEALAKKQRAKSMVSQAYERGFATRARASSNRAKYAGGGVSTRSGSAAQGEFADVSEGIRQQESLLAGLSKGHKWSVPHIMGNLKKGQRRTLQRPGGMGVGGGPGYGAQREYNPASQLYWDRIGEEDTSVAI